MSGGNVAILWVGRFFETLFVVLFIYAWPNVAQHQAAAFRICITHLLVFFVWILCAKFLGKVKLNRVFNTAIIFFLVFNSTQAIRNIVDLGAPYVLISELIAYLGMVFILSYNFKKARIIETGLVLFIVYSFRIFDTFLGNTEFALVHALSAIMAIHWFEDIAVRQNVPPVHALWRPFILLGISAVFSTFNAICPYNSLVQVGVMLNFIFVAFLIAHYLRTKQQVILVLYALLFVGIVLLILVFHEYYQRFSGCGRYDIWFRTVIGGGGAFRIHPNSIAGYFSALLCILIIGEGFFEGKRVRICFVPFIMIMFIVLLLTYSRLGILAFVVAVFTGLWLKSSHQHKNAYKKQGMVFLVLAIITAFMSMSPFGQRFLEKLISSHSSLQTFYSCKLSLQAIKDSLLFGYGPENYYVLSKYAQDLIPIAKTGMAFTRPVIWTPSHSLYVGLAFSYGVFGLLFFMWGVRNVGVYVLKLNNAILGCRRESGLLAGLFAAILSMIIHGALAMTYHLTILPAFFWVLIGLIVALGNVTQFNRVITYRWSSRTFMLSLLAVICFSFCFVINPIVAEKFYAMASSDFSSGKFDKALQNVDLAKSFMPINPKFFELSAEIKSAKGLIDGSIDAYDHALALKPDYAFYHTRRGQLYRRKREYAHALLEFRGAIDLDKYGVCHGEHYSDLGGLYMDLGMTHDAILQFKKALLIDAELLFKPAWEGATFLNAVLDQLRHDNFVLKHTDPLEVSNVEYVLELSRQRDLMLKNK